jgi:hypothetical protein
MRMDSGALNVKCAMAATSMAYPEKTKKIMAKYCLLFAIGIGLFASKNDSLGKEQCWATY